MPARLPCPKIPSTPPKNWCDSPSTSMYCSARKRTTAWAVVSRSVFTARHVIAMRTHCPKSDTRKMLCHDADIARADRDTKDGGGSIQVLTKVGAVLDLLAEHGELGAAEISAATGEPRSSVYRILGSLERLDMVEP